MVITSIADEIFRELGEPSDKSISAIAFYLRSNIGTLNCLLNKAFTIQDDWSVSPEINRNQAAVFKTFYFVYYYGTLVRETLGSGSVDSVVSIDDAGHKIRLVNKNEKSKTFLSLRRDYQQDLKDLVKKCKYGEFQPVQVSGNEEHVIRNSGLDT